MIRAGDYRHRVRLEVRVSTQDAAGEPYENWQTFATVRAAMQRTTGQELFEAAQRNARVATTFRIRYLAGVTPAMRLVLLSNNAVYDIVSVVDQAGRGEELVIQAQEQVGITAGPDGGPYVPPVTTLAAENVTVTPAGNLTSTDAQAALEELQGDVDALTAADTTEATARAAADTTLQANIDAEAAARATAVSGEATTRAAADDALDTRVTANEGNITSLLASIANAVLLTGAQTINGLKTFVAGIALQAKLTITGIASGANAIEIEDNTRIKQGTNYYSTASPDVYDIVRGSTTKFRINTGVAVTLFENVVISSTFPKLTMGSQQIQWNGGQLQFSEPLYLNGAPGHCQLYVGGPVHARGGVDHDSATLVARGTPADGATAIGTKTGSAATFSTAGAKLHSFDNNGTEKAFIDKDGNVEVVGAGGAVFLKSANGSRWQITVSNAGALVVTAA